MAACTKCGAALADGVGFCPTCGTKQGAGGAPAAASGAASSGGLEPNIAGALAYIWFVAIIWLVMEPFKNDKFIRFHAFQSLTLAGVAFVGWIVLMIIPILGWILLAFWGLGIFVTWVICVIKAFQKEMFKLPVIGDFAMKQAGS